MSYKYNPNDFGPGKPITAEMSIAYLEANWPTVLAALILRDPNAHLLIGNLDTTAIEEANKAGKGLAVQLDTDGLHLAMIDKATLLRMGGKLRP